MIGKLPLLGFSLVTALSSQALAHESHHEAQGSWRHQQERYSPAVAEVDLRYADLNRDGRVSMREALASGRHVFDRRDRDDNDAITRREAGGTGFRRDDRNNDGRVSLREHQRAVRAQFARLDANHDGYLGRRELGFGYGRPGSSRPAGWWR